MPRFVELSIQLERRGIDCEIYVDHSTGKRWAVVTYQGQDQAFTSQQYDTPEELLEKVLEESC